MKMPCILCVDDAARLRLVQEVLAAMPHVHLLTACNGRLGVEMALAHAPSLIVMDGSMPEMNGPEAQQRLRANPRTANIPVIAVSANAMPGIADSSLAQGFFRYLTKPVDVGDLLQAVGDGLAEVRARALRRDVFDPRRLDDETPAAFRSARPQAHRLHQLGLRLLEVELG